MNNTSCSESTIHSSFQNKIKSESTESLLLVSQNHFFLSRKVRVFIFITFLFLSIIVDIDNGIISSSSLKIKKDLCLSDSNYGLFASIPFTGRIFGLIIFMLCHLFQYIAQSQWGQSIGTRQSASIPYSGILHVNAALFP